MKLTGFADEAARDLATQIKATQELGWQNISTRGIDGKNIHDLSDAEFDVCVGQLEAANIHVPEFGSLIGTWGKSITTDFQLTIDEVERAIPRMKRLGTQLVRIMSYQQEPWGDDQQDEERFRRLREVVTRFRDAGLTPLHENCMNWGGFSYQHSLRLVEEVPGLKLIFDTGNPVFQRDRSKPEPQPWQDAWEFYENVRDHVEHVHVKDANMTAETGEPDYVMPGEGQGYVRKVMADLIARGYDGFVAIEPHVATVFHISDGEEPDWQQCYDSYVAYGRALQAMIESLQPVKA